MFLPDILPSSTTVQCSEGTSPLPANIITGAPVPCLTPSKYSVLNTHKNILQIYQQGRNRTPTCFCSVYQIWAFNYYNLWCVNKWIGLKEPTNLLLSQWKKCFKLPSSRISPGELQRPVSSKTFYPEISSAICCPLDFYSNYQQITFRQCRSQWHQH